MYDCVKNNLLSFESTKNYFFSVFNHRFFIWKFISIADRIDVCWGVGDTCKMNRDEQGGRGSKILKFRANILFEWPIAISSPNYTSNFFLTCKKFVVSLLYVLLMFLIRFFFGSAGFKLVVSFFLATPLVVSMFDFETGQISVHGSIKHTLHLYKFYSHVLDVLLSKSNYFRTKWCSYDRIHFSLWPPL